MLLLFPLLCLRNARKTRAALSADPSTGRPKISRQRIYFNVLVFQAIYGAFTLYVAKRNWIDLAQIPVSWWLVGLVVFVALASCSVKLAAVHSLRAWFRAHTGPTVDGLAPALSWREFPLFALLCVSTGLAEEFAFRLVIPLTLVGMGVNRWIALVLASLAFALIHAAQRGRGMLFAGVFGAVNQLLVWGTGSIWTAVLSHTLYDLLAGTLIAWRRDRVIARAVQYDRAP